MPNWDHVLREITSERDDPNGESGADKVRKKYLMKLHEKVGRNIICYYSGFLSKPRIEGSEINDDDKNGFMLCIHKLDKTKGLDLFLHTPGGSGAATESIVHYLKEIFGNDIRAIVPQIAMFAGTIIACACKEIVMGKHSNLGPTDPQINGLPAYAVIDEIKTAYDEIMADNGKQYVWNPILSRYTPGFVQQCHWAVAEGRKMVINFLQANMFSGYSKAESSARVDKIVTTLTELSSSKGHDKHIHYDACRDMGLPITLLEEGDKEIQDLILTIHHCFMFSLSNTPAFKIIENHVGRRQVKLFLQMLIPGAMPVAQNLLAPSGPTH